MVSLGLSRHIRSLIRTGSGLMIAALLLLMTMPFVYAAADPEITIMSPKANDKITGKDINVTVEMKNVDNACKWVGLADKDGQGHIHAMLDGMSMAQLTNFYCGTNTFTISGLGVKPGPHTLMVDIATNTHEDMDKTMKEVKFDYQPASPQAVPAAKKPASAPTAKINNLKDGAVLGPKFNLDIAADNFVPSADLEGKLNLEGYGHFHVFVDMPAMSPNAQGMMSMAGMIAMPAGPISVDLSAWPAGTHTLTVELVQNDHTPLTGAKEASVTFTLQGGTGGAQQPTLPQTGAGGAALSGRGTRDFLLPTLIGLGLALTASGLFIGRRLARR